VTLASTLAEHAFGIVVRDLEDFGNRLNERHRQALRRMLETYSSMACGEITGRFAFDLPTGCGKTQSLIAWCQAVHESRSGHSTVIAASKVEELCDIKRKLIDKGLAEECIGLTHSKEYDTKRAEDWLRTRDPSVLKQSGQTEYASLPKTADNEARQFLLVTHSRVQNRRTDLDLLNTFQGRRRDLIFWDESLLAAHGDGISKREIESALGWLTKWTAGGSGPEVEVVAYLRECLGLICHELDAQKQHRRKPQSVRLPCLSGFELHRYGKLLCGRVQTTPLSTFLTFGQRDLRVVPVSQGGGAVVTYDIAVPRELDNVVVLDASYPIRQLERLDRSIRPAPDYNGAVKRYDNVVIKHVRHGCGRGAMERSFDHEDAEERRVSQELCDVISRIDPEEGVIVFTFKDTGVDMRGALQRDLKAAGVDTRAMLKPLADDEKPRPRFRFLTWGQETATNDHSDCPNIVFAGVIHRSETDLAASIVGQQDNLLAVVPSKQITEVRRSECAHALYQAMSRGSCRETVNGQATPMRVWLIHYDNHLRDLIDKVMPGVRWETWTPKFVDPIQTKTDELLLQVLAYLRHLGPEVTKVSTKVVKEALEIADTLSRTFTRAVQRVSDTDAGWYLCGRSLQRAPSD
jgi:hypothetical protein